MPELIPAPVPASSAPEGGSQLNTSHVAGGGFGTAVGVAVVSLLNHYAHTHLTDADAVLIGAAALSTGVGIGHVFAKGGLLGLVRAFLHGARA